MRYFRRPTDEAEIDLTLEEFPTDGPRRLPRPARRRRRAAAGCLGLYPTGELTRAFVAAEYRRMGGARALLEAAEAHARSLGLTRLFLDTRHDLVEARALYVALRLRRGPALLRAGPVQGPLVREAPLGV